ALPSVNRSPEYDALVRDIARNEARRPRQHLQLRRLPAAERRETLIAAACELFAECGYDHASLDEVAERAGVTKVIVYRHFASKKDLYLQSLAIHRDELLSTLARSMA